MPSPPPDSSRPPASDARAHWALLLLLLAYVLSFIDRNVMAVLIAPIRATFDISDTQYGLLHGLAFSLFYTALGVPIGRLADSRPRRSIIGVGVLFWSAMTTACGLASNFWTLFAARMGVGVGEAALSPPAHSLLTDLYLSEKLPGAMSVFTLGITLGGGMAYMIGGWVYGALDGATVSLPLVGALEAWQLTFVLVGLPGFVVGALIWTIREPARRGALNASETPTALPFAEVLNYLAQHRRIYVAMLGSIALLALLGYGTMTWYVEMLLRRFGGDRASVGPAFGAIFIVAGSAGALVGGALAQRLAGRIPDIHLRLIVWTAALWALAGSIAPLMPSEDSALYAVAPVLFLLNGYFGVAIAGLQLTTPNEMRAQVSALMLLLANLLGLGAGPAIVGALTDYVTGGPETLHIALSGLTAVVAPAAAALAWSGLAAYRAKISVPSSST